MSQSTSVDPLELTRQLMAEGQLLGLEGAELRAFVLDQKEKQQTLDREEREREAERLERDAERQERDAERLRLERDAERQFQLEQLKIQNANQEGNRNNNSPGRIREDDGFKPKIPFLDDRDDIESWFHQFEHYARDCNLSDTAKASRVVYFLKGKARVIFSKLNEEDANDYDTLKHALYEGFQLTSEDYRKKFRQTKKSATDTYKEHITKLERYLDKWVELAECDQDVKDLKDLLVREQVLDTLPPDLAVHIRDRDPKSAKEIGMIANTYQQSRSNVKTSSTYVKPEKRRSPQEETRIAAPSTKPANQTLKAKLSDAEREKLRASGCCFICKLQGHVSRFCPNKRDTAGAVSSKKDTLETPILLEKLCGNCKEKKCAEVVPVKLNGTIVNALRDTGCTGIIVSKKFVPKEAYSAKMKETTLAEKDSKKMYHTAVVHIDSPYFVSETEVTVMDDPIYPVLIGKWYGLGKEKKLTPTYPVRDPAWYPGTAAVVTTRAQATVDAQKPSCSHKQGVKEEERLYSPADLKREQASDPTLKTIRQFANSPEGINGIRYSYKKEILYRTTKDRHGNDRSLVIVPKKLRNKVLSFGHDHPMAGHLGQRKTSDRIRAEFWWPGCAGDIRRYCLSCDTCQRTAPKSQTKKVPLGRMPPISSVFKRVAVDIIGPVKPMSESKKQYILVSVDYATRYPEAVALKNIQADTVAEALWEMWTRLGIPDEVITDQGTQFTSHLMKEVNDFLSIKHHMTAPFHPQANGLVERFNSTLKSMLKKLAIDQPREWDTFIPALLFAYREAPQESMGFSPFELLYGRSVKGPMQVLRQTWTEEEISGEQKTTAEYVVNLRNRIEETCNVARENLKKAASKQAHFFNKKTKPRTLEVGKRVLLLRPVKNNKLELTWSGPYKVVEKLNEFDYKIQVGRRTRIYHINLIKEYQERELSSATPNPSSSAQASVPASNEEESDEEDGGEEVVAVVMEEDNTMDDDIFKYDTQKMLPLLETQRTENVKNIHFDEKLDEAKVKEAKMICEEFEEFLTDVPKTTNLEKCSIEVTEKKPVFVKPRPIPHAMVETVEKEIEEMLKLHVIEPANSPYNSPIVLIKKKDGKYRFCSDLRALNNVVVFDAEPITDVDHLFQSLGKAKYFSKLDLTKGYWAIPIEEEDRDKTAFTTSAGQFRWANMPFGLKTATGVFNRMMRKLLNPIRRKDVHHFMDDVLIATETWEEHMSALKAVLQRLQEANLAAKPSKCYIGYTELPYLGHEVGGGKRWPESDKIKKIQDALPPTTKKELRSFLGLCNFYRSYIESYANIAVPLTDLTKKFNPDKLVWNDEARRSFETLKEKISQKPVLCMPDHSKPFVLRTDASDKGMGAVLMQEHEETLRPVAYQSKKFNGAESRYATVEKECLATVWGVGKFERYLYGKHFTIETDHRPLKHLQRQPNNPRLMRWALQLQPYEFTVRVIPGKDNHGADYMSRASYDE
ncbi:uncharacterized protein [Littorina saxatilis]|uniref:uncharacterized protein n=1 Tax=Littorina saxatilis TaxID=31220 RepID=UPI0038B6635E